MGGNSGGGSGSGRIGKFVRSYRAGGQSVNVFTTSKPFVGQRTGDRPSLYAYIGADDNNSRYLTVSTSHIPSTARGGGYGKGMYIAAMLKAKELGVGFRSDINVSQDARRVWQTLTAKGVRMTRSNKSGANVYTISPEEVQQWGTSERPWSVLESRSQSRLGNRRGETPRSPSWGPDPRL